MKKGLRKSEIHIYSLDFEYEWGGENHFWEEKLFNKKTPKPPIARDKTIGMPMDSMSTTLCGLSVLPCRDLSPQYSRRRLLRLSN